MNKYSSSTTVTPDMFNRSGLSGNVLYDIGYIDCLIDILEEHDPKSNKIPLLEALKGRHITPAKFREIVAVLEC